LPPESAAYALARYSRSPDSITESMEWVRAHDSAKFLESFYFQYGHASIADLGHVTLCFEGISELAATEIEDEPLWDGQARSSRYQDFSRNGCIAPPEFDEAQRAKYWEASGELLAAYATVHGKVFEHLRHKLPRPEEMKPDAYERNLKARAFDVARFLLPFGIPTGVGQVTSIRTLERQIRKMKASEYGELRQLGGETAEACAQPPAVRWSEDQLTPLAPTLAKYVDSDEHLRRAAADLALWAKENVHQGAQGFHKEVQVTKPLDTEADIVATLLYAVTQISFRTLYQLAERWSPALRREVIGVALQSRGKHDDLLRAFRNAPYAVDVTMDIGAYRDLHRHRRCHQFRQSYWQPQLGFSIPEQLAEAHCGNVFCAAVEKSYETARQLPEPGSHYLLPFATRGRFLFKMDFAQAEYIARLRSGVKGHFSYRRVAWLLKQEMSKVEPALAAYLTATDPAVEDPLVR
jgi:thymidylate synthase ThyX